MKARLAGITFGTFRRLAKLHGNDIGQCVRSCSGARALLIPIPTPLRTQLIYGEGACSSWGSHRISSDGGGLETGGVLQTIACLKYLNLHGDSRLLAQMRSAGLLCGTEVGCLGSYKTRTKHEQNGGKTGAKREYGNTAIIVEFEATTAANVKVGRMAPLTSCWRWY
eukprot:Filipodium_phascolosomae@DN1025_c0_g2_i1.p1